MSTHTSAEEKHFFLSLFSVLFLLLLLFVILLCLPQAYSVFSCPSFDMSESSSLFPRMGLNFFSQGVHPSEYCDSSACVFYHNQVTLISSGFKLCLTFRVFQIPARVLFVYLYFSDKPHNQVWSRTSILVFYLTCALVKAL